MDYITGFLMATVPLSQININTAVPVSALNPFNEWCTPSDSASDLFPQCIFDGKATLAVCRADMFATALLFISSWNRKYNVASPWHRPVWLKGDAYPAASPFLQELQNCKLKIDLNTGCINSSCRNYFSQDNAYNFSIVKTFAVAKNNFQDFPLHIEDSPNVKDVLFRWAIVNEAMPPWDGDKTSFSRLEKTLTVTEHNPQLIILDSFLWNGSMVELKNMLMRLKKRNCSVVVLASKLPPSNFALNSIWDNVVKITPRRVNRFSRYNMTINLQRSNGKKSSIRSHIYSVDGGNSWLQTQDGCDFLKPTVMAWMREGKTALQIVSLINNNPNFLYQLKRPMSASNLARLKREWGLRSYKPERKPRKPKTKKNQSPNSSSVE